MTLLKRILLILGIGAGGAAVYKYRHPEWTAKGLLPPKLPDPKKFPNSDYARLYEMTSGELVPVGGEAGYIAGKKNLFAVTDKSTAPRTHFFYKDTGNYQ